jgi:hypothetical protein
MTCDLFPELGTIDPPEYHARCVLFTKMGIVQSVTALSVFGAPGGQTLEMKLLSQIVVVLVTTGFSIHAESAPELNERTVDPAAAYIVRHFSGFPGLKSRCDES